MDEIRKVFSPEFRNRITAFLSYEILGRTDIEEICKLYVDKVSVCLADYGITLKNDPKVIPGLVNILEQGNKYGTVGARDLQKIVQQRFDGPLARIIASGQLNDLPHGAIQINAACIDNTFQFVAESSDQAISIGSSPVQTFGHALAENKVVSEYHRHKSLNILIQKYRHISRLDYREQEGIDYRPYLTILARKMQECGLKKYDINLLDTEILDKITRDNEEDGDNQSRQAKVERSEEDIFYPFSLVEMRDLITQLWKSQISLGDKTFVNKLINIRLVFIQESIRKTIVAFFGKSIQKDQSIWIGREIHQLYLKSTASLK